jgi:hypothetical protein
MDVNLVFRVQAGSGGNKQGGVEEGIIRNLNNQPVANWAQMHCSLVAWFASA